MTHPDHLDHVYQEMGERLSVALGPQSGELPPALLDLIEQLAKEETYSGDQNFLGLDG